MSDAPKISRPELPKRFYTDVSVAPADGGGFTALLDGRTLRTPLRRPLLVPTRGLAETLAAEWAGQGEILAANADRANEVAAATLADVYDKVGFLPRSS